MQEYVDRLAGGFVAVDQELEREFEVRLTETATLAFRVAFSVLRVREDAEDVAQDAFAKAHRAFRQLRDREKFRAWLVRMTWRLALNRQRADRRRLARESAQYEAPVADNAVALIEERQRAERLWRAIDALPERLRLVVVLANIEEHDLADVAALVGAPKGTVKSRLFDARRRLKEALK